MSKVNLKECTYEDMEDECFEVMGTQFGHNIISLICQVAEDRFGKEKAKSLFNRYQRRKNENKSICNTRNR